MLDTAAGLFGDAYTEAIKRREVGFNDEFWATWDAIYSHLNRDRPDTRFAAATARGVTMVLRFSLIHALMDRASAIGVEHLAAGLALWNYCEASARWLFSTHELESQSDAVTSLAAFIRDGGTVGRTRTEISKDYFKRNVKAAAIDLQLTQLVHDGVVVETKDETGGRPVTRYMYASLPTNENTNNAGQKPAESSYATKLRTKSPGDNSSEFADERTDKIPPDLDNSSNSLIRTPSGDEGANSQPPGAPTEHTPGMTERVQQILANARNGQRPEER